LVAEQGITAYDAGVLVNQGRAVVDYYLKVAKGCDDGKQASNWVQRDVLRHIKESEITIDAFGVSADSLAALIKTIQSGDLDNSRGSEVFEHMLENGADVKAAMSALGIEKVNDSAIDELCRELLAANPKVVADVQSGNQKAIGALIGQAKKRNPNVSPNDIRSRCLAIIAES